MEGEEGNEVGNCENADLEYILDLFNTQDLNLTITEDTEEN